jgi:nitrate/nitrite-specific signal transduction histidine kinase
VNCRAPNHHRCAGWPWSWHGTPTGILRRVLGGISAAVAAAEAVASGDYDRRLEVDGRDEVARLGMAMNRVATSLGELHIRLSKGIAANADALGQAAGRMTATSQTLSDAATATATQSSTAANAADQISGNIASVVTAIEEMSASTREISGNTAEAARIAREAVDMATSVGTTAQDLAQAADAIGSIVKTTTAITAMSFRRATPLGHRLESMPAQDPHHSPVTDDQPRRDGPCRLLGPCRLHKRLVTVRYRALLRYRYGIG